jgi:hypothetical protein
VFEELHLAEPFRGFRLGLVRPAHVLPLFRQDLISTRNFLDHRWPSFVQHLQIAMSDLYRPSHFPNADVRQIALEINTGFAVQGDVLTASKE